jgi:hypothetical protein
MFGQLNWAGPMPCSHPTWYLTHEYVGRDQACDLQKPQVAPLAVPLILEGRKPGCARREGNPYPRHFADCPVSGTEAD